MAERPPRSALLLVPDETPHPVFLGSVALAGIRQALALYALMARPARTRRARSRGRVAGSAS